MATVNDLGNNSAARASLLDSRYSSVSKVSFEKVMIIREVSSIHDPYSGLDKVIKDFGGLKKIPRNSYIGKRITNGLGTIDDGSSILLFPFFSSHMSLPLKVGETAWVLYDRDIINQGFWITRCHSDEEGEDLNFSHYDRRYSMPKTKVSIADVMNEKNSTSEENRKKSYPNLSGLPSSMINSIFRTANSKDLLEPVPRYTKRSGDLVINGSNNAQICLGTDRYWTKDENNDGLSGTNAFIKDIQEFSGCIDIVAGRSRGLVSGSIERTSPRVQKNESRNYSEVEKGDPVAQQGNNTTPYKIQSEGDPDFFFDAARLYVAMNTEVDNSISLQEFTPIFPTETEVRDPYSGAGIIAKSDHVRIVARKYEDENFKINGTIKIVKEGALSGEGADGSSIIMHSDGNLHIAAAQKIFLGLGKEDGGIDPETDGKGISQPYIKYQELKSLVVLLLQQIDSLKKSFNDHVSKYNSHSHKNTVGVPPGSPLAIIPPELDGSSSISHDYEFESEIKQQIPNIKSSRIFGE